MQDVLSTCGILSYNIQKSNCKERENLRFGINVEEENAPANEAEHKEGKDEEGKQRNSFIMKTFMVFFFQKRGNGQ